MKQYVIVEMEKEKVECTGKGVFSLVMGIIYLIIDIYLFTLTIKMEQVVIPVYLIVIMNLVVIMIFALALYFLLYWKNKKIVLSDDEIIYYSIIGKKRTYSWNNVKKVYYAIGGRCSQGRIIIVVDKKISLEKHMKNFLRAEKMVKEKGYLEVKIK